MPDDDTPDMPPRRWEDVVKEIEIRVPAAVRQEMTTYRLLVEETARDVGQLKTVIFGSPTLGVRGVVPRMEALESKIDVLIDGQTQREADWRTMRTFLDQERDRQIVLKTIQRHLGIAAAVLSTAATFLGIVGGLVALGVIKL